MQYERSSVKLELRHGLPFTPATLFIQEKQVFLENVLVDTGSAGSVFSADKLFEAGLSYEPEDTLRRVFGVGGSEFVFTKQIRQLQVGELTALDLTITVGAMDYGIELDGILGMDFLRQVKAVINIETLELEIETLELERHQD
jgi:predicted aspartyl protease